VLVVPLDPIQVPLCILRRHSLDEFIRGQTTMCHGLASDGRYPITTITRGLFKVIFNCQSFTGVPIGSHDWVNHDVATHRAQNQGCDPFPGWVVTGTSKMQLQELDMFLDIFHELLHSFISPEIHRPFQPVVFSFVPCVQCRPFCSMFCLEC